MKIRRLNSDLQGVSDKIIVDKINEIIDFLNNSFITDEPDIVSIQCDRLIPYSNETTSVATVNSSYTVSDFVNLIGDTFDLELNPWSDKKCPHCGASHFSSLNSSTTALYCPPVYKDGVNINNMKNKCTTTYHCYACNKDWEETD